MAVEKAITFDDLANEGTDAEKREGFRRGGFRGRRSGRMGSVRGARSRARSRGGFKGRRSARGASVKGAKARSVQNRAKASKQGQTRRGTTTTAAAVSRAVADKQNKMGTKYAGNLQKAIADANKRAFDKSLEGRKLAAAQAAVAQNPNLRAGTVSGDIAARAEVARMDAARGSLLDKAKRNQISTAELARLADMNQAIGLNPTTGMGLVESMRFNTKDVNLGDIAKLAGFVTNPVGSVVSAALTGGQGILGTLKDAGQTAFAGLTGQEAPKSGSLFGSFGLGNLMDRFKNIDIGPAAPTPPDRGGRRDERMMAQMPPVQPTLTVMPRSPFDPKRIKKAVTPVGTAVTDQAMNEYLRLAGLA